MKKLRRACLFICFGAATFISCREASYEMYHNITGSQWDKEQKLLFHFDSLDASQLFKISLLVRHGNTYPFRNIWFFISTYYPNGEVEKDTVNMFLANLKGQWLGVSGGGLITCEQKIKPFYSFRQSGTIVMELVHGMRVNPLPNVYNVGLKMEVWGKDGKK